MWYLCCLSTLLTLGCEWARYWLTLKIGYSFWPLLRLAVGYILHLSRTWTDPDLTFSSKPTSDSSSLSSKWRECGGDWHPFFIQGPVHKIGVDVVWAPASCFCRACDGVGWMPNSTTNVVTATYLCDRPESIVGPMICYPSSWGNPQWSHSIQETRHVA